MEQVCSMTCQSLDRINMDEKHIKILKDLGFDISQKDLTNDYWKKRAAEALALTTQDRDVYGCLDHTVGEGVRIFDIEGTEYLDVTGGVAVRALGLRYKPYHDFEASINDVVHELPGMDFDAIPQTLLAERVAGITPGNHKKRVIFTTSGGRAVEGCMKSAMDLTGRRRFVAFRPAFHGRTGYALALTSSNSKHKSGFPQGVDVIRVFYPYCYRCPYGTTEEDCSLECVEALRYALEVEGNDIAATVMEPLCGEGGLIVPPAKAVKGIYDLTKEIGAYFMSDEVQAGMGRTGKWCAIENHGVVPDYISMGKAIGGGYPMGASIGPAPMFTGGARHSETFSAEPKMSLLSLWIFKHLEDGEYLKKNVENGEYLKKRFNELKDKYEVIGDVRGLGLMIGMEIVKDKKTKEKARKLRDSIVKNAVQKQKLWVLGAGQNVIRFTPSYIITRENIDDVTDRLDKAIREEM
ncbi:MAG: aminotransferase class III-fold pyridoxal phosphate-dependent enzyme [Candidatus Thorarchaeota archaeon]|nr:aminotransferase class III-fold pyridoxal phosphate-dependent enzyme [Candidatus Thorarchaeota archaeon]